MSYHTREYLHRNVLKGNTENTGFSWWLNQQLEDPERPSHYEGFLPITLVEERLFGWEAKESGRLVAYFQVPVRDSDGEQLLDKDNHPVFQEKEIEVTDFKALAREDWLEHGVPETEEDGANVILSVQGKDWTPHQLKKTFIGYGSQLVQGSDQLGIESAGLLKWGRRAWMTIAIPNNLHNDASGVDFRPHLTFSTSFDGSMGTRINRTYGIPVCDNTLDYEILKAGDTGSFSIRHTKNSEARIKDAVEALGLLHAQAEDMDAWLTEMVKIEVTDADFQKWMDLTVPIPELKQVTTQKSIQGQMVDVVKTPTNSLTNALNKRDILVDLWTNDPRVSPWAGTKYGIVALNNTWMTHPKKLDLDSTEGAEMKRINNRILGNQTKVISGAFRKSDTKAIENIDLILAEKIVVPVASGRKKVTPAAKA